MKLYERDREYKKLKKLLIALNIKSARINTEMVSYVDMYDTIRYSMCISGSMTPAAVILDPNSCKLLIKTLVR